MYLKKRPNLKTTAEILFNTWDKGESIKFLRFWFDTQI